MIRCVTGGVWVRCGVAIAALLLSGPWAAAAPKDLIKPDMLLRGHADGIMALAFSADGKWLASGSHDNTARLWDAASGKMLHVFEGHTDAVYGVSFSPDGTLLATCSTDKTIKIWNLSTFEKVAQLEGHAFLVRNVVFLPDGRLLSAGGDGLRLWDVKTKKLLWRSVTDGSVVSVHCMTVSADGKFCAYSLQRGDTSVWDLTTRKEIVDIGMAKYYPSAIGLSADGHALFALGLHGTEQDPSQRFERLDLKANTSTELMDERLLCSGFAITSDGKYAVGVPARQPIVMWDAKEWKQLATLDFSAKQSDPARAVAISPDSSRIAVASTGTVSSNKWNKGTSNVIGIFPNPLLRAVEDKPQVAGAAAGSISWEQIPAVVKRGSEAPIPLREYKNYQDDHQGLAFAIEDKFDVILSRHSILLHKTKGELEELTAGSDTEFSDVAFDGKVFWVCDVNDGVMLIDPTSHSEIARVGAGVGIPKKMQAMHVHALATGTVLAIATTKTGTAWCGVLQRDAARADVVHTKTLVAEGDKPAGWAVDKFRPQWMTEPPRAEGKKREVLIVCSGERSGQPILKVDAESLALSNYNLLPNAQTPSRQTARRPDTISPGIWLNSDTYLSAGGIIAQRMKMGADFFDVADTKRLYFSYEGGPDGPILEQDGILYWVGKSWIKLNPVTSRAQDLGPGLRVNGELAGTGVRQYKSAILGLAALSGEGGFFYKFSTDAAHPAPIHATLDVPRGEPIPSNGAIEEERNRISFFVGQAGLSVDGKSVLDIRESTKYRLPLMELERQVRVARAKLSNSAVLGLGITTEQNVAISRAMSEAASREAPETEKIVGLCAIYRSPNSKPADKERAANDILASVRAYGDVKAEGLRKQLEAIKSALTPAQWEKVAPR